ncbi:MAG TPA: DUF3619 family protein [Gallionella sp.]
MNTDTRPAKGHPHDIAPESIAKLLSRAAGELDAGTLAALQRAHNIALARQSLHKPVLSLGTAHGIHWPVPHSTSKWKYAATILLAAALVSVASYWHHERDTSHLDIAILTDDLPMEIFVDR